MRGDAGHEVEGESEKQRTQEIWVESGGPILGGFSAVAAER